jgi:hypothetical protein
MGARESAAIDRVNADICVTKIEQNQQIVGYSMKKANVFSMLRMLSSKPWS